MVIAKNHGGTLWARLFIAQPGKTAEWGAWQTLGSSPAGGILGRPQVISFASNHADVYVRGADSGLYHRTWNGATSDGKSWGPWERVGTWQMASDPSVVSWGPGRIDVFARGLDDALIHTSHENGWQGWEHLGGIIDGRPSAISAAPGHLDIYVRGRGNDRLFHKWFTGSSWIGFEVIGEWQIDSSPVALTRGPGDVNVYARGKDGALIGTSYSNGWTGWGNLGGVIKGEPVPISWGPGHVDVYVRGSDDQVYHRWFGSSVGWQPWEGTGSGATSGSPSPFSVRPGHLHIVAERASGEVIDRWFENSWQPSWESMGVPAHSFMGGRLCKAAPTWQSGSMLGLSLGTDIQRVAGSQLGTFLEVVNCLRDVTGGRSKIGLRMQLRYDSGVAHGANGNNPQLAAFKQLLDWVPNAQPIISVVSTTFDRCNDTEGPWPTQVGFHEYAQNTCTYPSESAYPSYFSRLLTQVTRQLGRNDALFTAWNEPDVEMFTLRFGGGIDSKEDAATRAGKYWKQAVSVIEGSDPANASSAPGRVLAGEFASDQSGALKSKFRTAAGQTPAPTEWAYHPYDDMTLGGSTPFARTDNFQGSGSALWLTEIGVKANVDPSPVNSRVRGTELRTRLGAKATRAILYDLTTAHPSGFNDPKHDSSLTDDAGRARPVLCGLGDVQAHACVGTAASGGDVER